MSKDNYDYTDLAQANIQIMDDIVEQLRYWSNKWYPRRENGDQTMAGSLMNDAADEIERLQRTLEKGLIYAPKCSCGKGTEPYLKNVSFEVGSPRTFKVQYICVNHPVEAKTNSIGNSND